MDNIKECKVSELLNCCNADLNPIEPRDRDTVHKEGIWHKTSHVWLYDSEGYVYFQVRADADKLYTSASGHVGANEDTKNAAVREMGEELGLRIWDDELELIEIDAWKFDNEVKHDHAFAYIYLYKIARGFTGFSVNPTEVSDVVKVKAKDLLGHFIGLPFPCPQFDVHGKKLKKYKELLLMDGEIAVLKYGRILKAIVERTNNE